MNELQILTQQTPSSITWNFDELKAQLTAEMKNYETLVYTDATIKDAKADVAGLRKLQKEVDARRIEIKKACLAPYETFEEQANELKAIIEKPIALIDEKVKDYEERRKQSVIAKIKEYWSEVATRLPENIRERVFSRIYSDKWLNATTKVSVWKEAMDAGIESVLSDYKTIKGMPNDFVEDGLQKYEECLMLNEAIQYMNALQRQKQIAEERLAEEQRRKEEAAKREAELKMQETQQNEEVSQNAPESPKTSLTAEPKEIHRPSETNAPCGENKEEMIYVIRFKTEKDMREVEKYCKFSEIEHKAGVMELQGWCEA